GRSALDYVLYGLLHCILDLAAIQVDIGCLADRLGNFCGHWCGLRPLRNRPRNLFDNLARASLPASFFFSRLFDTVLREGSRPVLFERTREFFNRPTVAEDDSDLAPRVKFQLAQALAPYEGVAAVANDGARVQTHSLQLAGCNMLRRHAAYHANVHSCILA